MTECSENEQCSNALTIKENKEAKFIQLNIDRKHEGWAMYTENVHDNVHYKT